MSGTSEESSFTKAPPSFLLTQLVLGLYASKDVSGGSLKLGTYVQNNVLDTRVTEDEQDFKANGLEFHSI